MNRQDIIDTIDPDMVQCYFCKAYYHKTSSQIGYITTDGVSQRICLKCPKDHPIVRKMLQPGEVAKFRKKTEGHIFKFKSAHTGTRIVFNTQIGKLSVSLSKHENSRHHKQNRSNQIHV